MYEACERELERTETQLHAEPTRRAHPRRADPDTESDHHMGDEYHLEARTHRAAEVDCTNSGRAVGTRDAGIFDPGSGDRSQITYDEIEDGKNSLASSRRSEERRVGKECRS